ncbi:RsmB/NOP family class I SAM-dependent RNA methyltransferase [Glacieibacterium sp.]|uniref:RsmB/NOP family class I SAM-dependent RNA methyltransferase n=1 Tax=Glacieibacterium sp. TaxID=2860237 RepID=UPI003AFF9FED
MLPAARVQASIDCLEAIVAAARDGGAAADTIISRYFQTRRYAGSKDRRAVRELIYAVIRTIGERPETGRAAMLGYARAVDPALLELFDGGAHSPAVIAVSESEAAPSPAPAWLEAQLHQRFGDDTPRQLAALLERAPLDLRVNTLKAQRDTVAAELETAEPVAAVPDALRATAPLNVDLLPAYIDGRIEVQDLGSQIAMFATAARAGDTVVDLCAGAGGKTLALAAAMANEGRLIATDTDRARLRQLEPRAVRAGASIIETRLLDPRREAETLSDLEAAADLVLIDAPCSGTGTWRRNPEARWRLTPDRLDRLADEQARLVGIGAALVKPGGRLVYVVCSLLPAEGEAQIDAFLDGNAEWQRAPLRNPDGGAAVSTLVLTPGDNGCDGFFIAGLARAC